ncbi:MAG: hypothetical protein ACE5HR_00340 [bacterium]
MSKEITKHESPTLAKTDSNFDPVFRGQPLEHKGIPRLTTLRGDSPERYAGIKTPTFVNPTTKETYMPIVGRIISIATMRVYRTKDDTGKIDWSMPPLCYSDDGNGRIPSTDLENPYSQECTKRIDYIEMTRIEPVCQFAKWTKSKDSKRNIPPECAEIVYFLVLLEESSLPVWVYFDRVALPDAKKFINKLKEIVIKKKISHPWDYIIKIGLRQDINNKGGDIKRPVHAEFTIMGRDTEDDGFNPDEEVRELVQNLTTNAPNLLNPTITGINYDSETN